MSMLKAARE